MAYIKDLSDGIHLWELTDDLADLTQKLQKIDPQFNLELPASTLLKRKLEFVSERLLLHRILGTTHFDKDANGKPFLSNDKNTHISFSHSHECLILFVSKEVCGVDIEMVHPRVLNVEEKFAGEEEKQLFEKIDESSLTILWSIKEACMKCEGEHIKDFKNTIVLSKLIKENAGYFIFEAKKEKAGKTILFQGTSQLWAEKYWISSCTIK